MARGEGRDRTKPEWARDSPTLLVAKQKPNTSKKPFFSFPPIFFTSSFEKVGEICSGTLEGGEGIESIRRAVVSGGGRRGESTFASCAFHDGFEPLLLLFRLNSGAKTTTRRRRRVGRRVLSFACSRQCRRCID